MNTRLLWSYTAAPPRSLKKKDTRMLKSKALELLTKPIISISYKLPSYLLLFFPHMDTHHSKSKKSKISIQKQPVLKIKFCYLPPVRPLLRSTITIEYANINNPNDTFLEKPTYKKSDTGLESFGASYYFPAARRDNAYYAHSGYSIFVLACSSKQHLETIGRLGHQEGKASLSVSIRGGLDISFSPGRDSLGSSYEKLMPNASLLVGHNFHSK